jgi:hypothetical protein
MKRLMATAVVAVLITLGWATPTLAQQIRNFEAELHQFSPPVGPCVDGVCDFKSYGYGFTNLLGPVTVTVEFTWDFTTTPCSTLDPLVFTLVGATGSVTISGTGAVCDGLGPYGFPQFFSGTAQITAGTGEFSGISGAVSARGVIAQRGPIAHMSGTGSY